MVGCAATRLRGGAVEPRNRAAAKPRNRLFRRAALDRFVGELSVGGSHFLPEMVILALKKNLKVIEVPVNYRGRVGESKITGTLKLEIEEERVRGTVEERLGFVDHRTDSPVTVTVTSNRSWLTIAAPGTDDNSVRRIAFPTV